MEHTRRRPAVAAVWLVAVLGGALAGAGPRSVRAEGPVAPPAVHLGGVELDLDRDVRAQVVDIGRAWLATRVVLVGPDHHLERSRHWFGGRFDVARAEHWVSEIRNPDSPSRRHRADPGAPFELPLPVSFEHERVFELLVDLKDDLDRLAVDARVDTETREVLPDATGYELDVWKTLERFEASLLGDGRPVEIVALTTQPRLTRERVGAVDMSTVLGTFETRYSLSNRAADRTFNLRVAAQKIDGMVLMPGEELDFNQVVGERSEVNGFRVAPVIAAGELVDGIGGGTCQISGTLHAAVLFSGLEILDRRPHSRPSYYIKLGLDAAVSYPDLNFRFRNDRPFPVVVGLEVAEGSVTATLWGAAHARQVTFVRRIDEAMAFEEREVEDPELPAGVRVLSQRGVPGFRLHRWRIVRDLERNQAIREAATETYPPTTQIWRVGTGEPAPEEYVPPPDDEHPEYTADEYLSMTQGQGIDGTLEARRAGRYGVPGWTIAAGFAEAPEE